MSRVSSTPALCGHFSSTDGTILDARAVNRHSACVCANCRRGIWVAGNCAASSSGSADRGAIRSLSSYDCLSQMGSLSFSPSELGMRCWRHTVSIGCEGVGVCTATATGAARISRTHCSSRCGHGILNVAIVGALEDEIHVRTRRASDETGAHGAANEGSCHRCVPVRSRGLL